MKAIIVLLITLCTTGFGQVGSGRVGSITQWVGSDWVRLGPANLDPCPSLGSGGDSVGRSVETVRHGGSLFSSHQVITRVAAAAAQDLLQSRMISPPFIDHTTGWP